MLVFKDKSFNKLCDPKLLVLAKKGDNLRILFIQVILNNKIIQQEIQGVSQDI